MRAAREFLGIALFSVVLIAVAPVARSQSLGNAGTIEGTVTDPSGAAVGGAAVTLKNAVTNYQQTTTSSSTGTFRLTNIPPNEYQLTVSTQGFAPWSQSISIRNPVPVEVAPKLEIATSATTVNIEATGAQVEFDPTAHVDVDRNLISELPIYDPGAGLSQAITYSTGAVAAGENGFFHPLGDHAQAAFVIDDEAISDQQSKVFSTQLPTSAIQSMEIDTGMPEAEFGDKTSLVAQITTRSGLGAQHQFGSVSTSYGSFGSVSGDVSYGVGTSKFGNFFAAESTRSGRFFDTPEFFPIHDIGNNQSIFDRIDYQPSGTDILHLNIFLARNWTQIPNSFDQLSQDQRQRVLTWNIAPGYQHTFNAHTLLTVSPFARKDQFNYYPSRDPFNDTPSTQSQSRQLFNYGIRSDLSINRGRHNLKIGTELKQTRLIESFNFGITDPTFNAVCNDQTGAAVTTPSLKDPNTCQALGYVPNPNLQPGLIPFDLSRGGSLFSYRATHNIDEYSFFVQDSITFGPLLLSLGMRGDLYYGLTSKTQPEPRVGLAYRINKTNTVLRLAYAHTMETPFNENLLLSSASGLSNGIALAVLGVNETPAIQPGLRNQYDAGLQQRIGKYILVDGEYFWKYTRNAYDFSILQNTTITFPIAWNKSKLDGVTAKISTTDIHGFMTYLTVGHNRARYFPPQSGGLLNTSAVPPGVFRIDHDQAFQSTVVTRYQRPRNAEYFSFIWRHDSGLVVSGVPDVFTAISTLTPNQQVDIGLACNGVPATLQNPFNANTPCDHGTSTLLSLPQTGTENDDHNPARVKPRSIFDLEVGTENLLHAEGRRRILAVIQVENLTNTVALYNFLSTFTGTHFIQPRTVVGRVGFTF